MTHAFWQTRRWKSNSDAGKHAEILADLGIETETSGVFYGGKWHEGKGEGVQSVNPSTNQVLGVCKTASLEQTHEAINCARQAHEYWRRIPAPVRGELVRKVGLALRDKKDQLASLVALEVGKVKAEALQDVESAIHMTGYTLGLGKSMSGRILPSETPHQLLLENYHPLGVVASITSFNSVFTSFFVDAAMGLTCGNALVWKPALSAHLTAVATTKIITDALYDANPKLASIMSLVTGGAAQAETIAKSRQVNLVSFTGSTEVGRKINTWVAERFGKVMLELAGNNAIIVMDDANLNLALRSVVFSATASTAQRCTTTRRLFVQQGCYDIFFEHLTHAYKQLQIGDPLDPSTLIGPLHHPHSVKLFNDTLDEVRSAGGDVLFGGQDLSTQLGGNFVRPAIVRIDPTHPIVQKETFAPILFTGRFKELSQALQWNNMVPQGLSSSLFSQSMNASFKFISPSGSDCGVINVVRLCVSTTNPWCRMCQQPILRWDLQTEKRNQDQDEGAANLGRITCVVPRRACTGDERCPMRTAWRSRSTPTDTGPREALRDLLALRGAKARG